jgi:hypothetical protein
MCLLRSASFTLTWVPLILVCPECRNVDYLNSPCALQILANQSCSVLLGRSGAVERWSALCLLLLVAAVFCLVGPRKRWLTRRSVHFTKIAIGFIDGSGYEALRRLRYAREKRQGGGGRRGEGGTRKGSIWMEALGCCLFFFFCFLFFCFVSV